MNESKKRFTEISYKFLPVDACPMCMATKKESKLLGLRLNCSQGLRPKLNEGIAVSVRRCNYCDLIYPSPLPIPLNLQDHYGIPPADYWGGGGVSY